MKLKRENKKFFEIRLFVHTGPIVAVNDGAKNLLSIYWEIDYAQQAEWEAVAKQAKQT